MLPLSTHRGFILRFRIQISNVISHDTVRKKNRITTVPYRIAPPRKPNNVVYWTSTDDTKYCIVPYRTLPYGTVQYPVTGKSKAIYRTTIEKKYSQFLPDANTATKGSPPGISPFIPESTKASLRSLDIALVLSTFDDHSSYLRSHTVRINSMLLISIPRRKAYTASVPYV